MFRTALSTFLSHRYFIHSMLDHWRERVAILSDLYTRVDGPCKTWTSTKSFNLLNSLGQSELSHLERPHELVATARRRDRETTVKIPWKPFVFRERPFFGVNHEALKTAKYASKPFKAYTTQKKNQAMSGTVLPLVCSFRSVMTHIPRPARD